MVTFAALSYMIMRHITSVYASCADPESFVRGGPTLTRLFFLVDGERIKMRIKMPLKVGNHRPASETPFAGVPIMAHH